MAKVATSVPPLRPLLAVPLTLGLIAALLVVAQRSPATAQEAEAPHQLDLAVAFEGDYAIDARYVFEVFVDSIASATVEATPPAASASLEIPAQLIGEQRAEQLVRIEASRGVGFSFVDAEVGWDCGQGLTVATAIEFTISDASTTTCTVTTYGPWRLQVDLDADAQAAGVAAALFVGDDAGFNNPALFSGLYGTTAVLTGSLHDFDAAVEWVATELACDDGATYPLNGQARISVEVARDPSLSALACTIQTESTDVPAATSLVIGYEVLSSSYNFPTATYLQIDDGPLEEWFWGVPSSFSRTFASARTVTVTERIDPDADWATVGFECANGVNASWVDLGDGRSQATIALIENQTISCAFHYVYLPTAPVRVVVDYPADPDAPWLDYRVEPQWETGRLMPGSTLGLTVGPNSTAGLALEAPNILWTLDLVCTSPGLILERLDSEGFNGEQAVFFRLDGSAGSFDVVEECTVVVEPAAPVTLRWTKVYPADPAQEFIVQVSGRTATVRHDETVSFDVSAGAVSAVEAAPSGTLAEPVVCILNGETLEFPPRGDGEWAVVVIPEGVAPGSVISCTSTSTMTSTATMVPLTLIHDGEGTPATFVIQAEGQDEDPIVISVDDELVVDVPRSLRWIAMQAGASRRFVDVSCSGFQFSGTASDVALISPRYIEADAASCAFASQAIANDSITITIDGVLNTMDGPVPAFDTIELSHRIGEPFFGPPSPAADPEVTISEPVGWRGQFFQCSDGATTVDTSDQLTLVIDVDAVTPGTAIDCVVSFVPDATIPLRLEVSVPAEPDTIVDVGFALSDRPELVLTQANVGETVVRHDRGSLRINPQPVAGFAPGFARCYNVGGSELLPNSGWGYWTISWSGASEIVCRLELRRVAPAQLVIESQIDGAPGNGGLRFTTRSHGEIVSSDLIDGAGSLTIDVPIGEVFLDVDEPPTWTNLTSLCDRDFDVSRTDDGFAIEFLAGETVRCTFVNRLVNQNVGASGDATCDGLLDIVDALAIAQHVAGVRSGADACPLASSAGELMLSAADFDASGAIDIIDALQVAQCVAGLSAPACPPAPAD